MEQMIGKPLKNPRGYVFVGMPNHTIHIYLGEQPNAGDATACGIRIRDCDPWSQRATALKPGTYCRECEDVQRRTR